MDMAVSGATPTQPPIPPIPQRPVDQAPAWVMPVIRQTIWRIIWVGLGMAILVLSLLQARGLISTLVIAFFFSIAMDPAVTWLHTRRGWSRGRASGTVFLVVVVSVVAADHGPDPRPGPGRRAGRVAHPRVDRGRRAHLRGHHLLRDDRPRRPGRPVHPQLAAGQRPTGPGHRKRHRRDGVPVPDHRDLHPVLRRRRTQDPPGPAGPHAPGAPAAHRLGVGHRHRADRRLLLLPVGPAPDQRDAVLLRDGRRGGAVAGRPAPGGVPGLLRGVHPRGRHLHRRGHPRPGHPGHRGSVAGPRAGGLDGWSSSRSRTTGSARS